MGKSRRLIRRMASFWGVLTAVLCCNIDTSVQAADSVVIRFGEFAESISLAELQTMATTGKFPDGYSMYTKRLSEEQRLQILAALRTEIPVGVVTMNRLLNTPVGTTILTDLSKAIIRKDAAGVQAIRGGLVLGATAPQGLSVLTFIAAYPSKQLEIDLPQAFQVGKNLNVAFWQTQRFLEAIAPQLQPRKINLSLPFDPSQSGTSQVKVINFNLDDAKRQRRIPVDLYWSDAVNTERPLILFTHGLGSVRTELRYLAEHLASHGYAVAALEHPGSNGVNLEEALAGKTRLMKPAEFLERPQDISVVLDQLAVLNRTSSSPVFGKLATNKALVLGYSFGGSTALVVGGAEYQLEQLKQRCKDNLASASLGEGIQCIAQELSENNYQFRDERVKSVIAISPTTSLLFGDTGLSKIAVPTLIWSASADKTTPALTEQIIGFGRMKSPKLLAGVIGATHLSVKDPTVTLDQRGKISTPLSGGEVVDTQAADIRKYLKAIVVAFAAQLTPEAEKYSIFLTSDYAQFASTKDFPIRLIPEIPSAAMEILQKTK
jgi:predicted dienelactone hydrolase